MSDRAAFNASYEAAPKRQRTFATMSGGELDPVYGPDDAELPGQYPYTRGIFPSMYRSKLWTMRQFAGFGSASDTNARFHQLLASGGTQSLHTDSFDEALALPTEKAARLALRTQQVIAEETGVANVADPLGGSWFVEALTDRLDAEAEAIFTHLRTLGGGDILPGVYAAIEEGWFQNEIADAAYRAQRAVASGEAIIVGVNGYTNGDDRSETDILYIDQAVETEQLARLTATKAARDDAAVQAALEAITEAAANETANLMEPLITASRVRCTVGEQMQAMEKVFGTWIEPALP